MEKKKKLPVLVSTIRVVDIWPNSFFLCLLFRWSKFGQGTNNRQPWIFLLGPYEIYLFLSFSLFLHTRASLLNVIYPFKQLVLYLYSETIRL